MRGKEYATHVCCLVLYQFRGDLIPPFSCKRSRGVLRFFVLTSNAKNITLPILQQTGVQMARTTTAVFCFVIGALRASNPAFYFVP